MRERRSTPAAPVLIDLAAVLSCAGDEEVLGKPGLSELIVEYACWEREMAEWHARQPRRRDPAYAGWIGEGRGLFDRLDELKDTARRVLNTDDTGGNTPTGTIAVVRMRRQTHDW